MPKDSCLFGRAQREAQRRPPGGLLWEPKMLAFPASFILLGLFQAVTWQIKFQDNTVMKPANPGN